MDELGRLNGSSSIQTEGTGSGPADTTTIELSFSNKNGGAWDDRELINAYDAAMDEFHLHHPGPGSWLDKATAALAKGQPLPGAASTSTSWYTASYTKSAAELTAGEVTTHEDPTASRPTPKRSKKENGRPTQHNGKSTNPYTSYSSSRPNGTEASRPRRTSPTYAPQSPPQNPALVQPQEQWDHPEEWYDQSYDLEDIHDATGPSHPRPSTSAVPLDHQAVSLAHAAPSLSVQPTSGIDRDTALGYAMSAQYWAGYWMGVAQARDHNTQVVPEAVAQAAEEQEETFEEPSIRSQPLPSVPNGATGAGGGMNGEAGAGSNIVRTQKHFTRPPIGHALKR